MMKKIFLNKNFFLLWTGQMVSQIGDKFYSIALAWWILQETHSSVIMGLFMVASALPGLLFGIFAGVLIDKLNRKNLIIGSDILRGVSVLLVSLLSIMGKLELWHIFTVAIIISLASAFFDPTITAVIPQIVKKKDLPKANSLSEMIDAISIIIGPVIGAACVGYFGFEVVFLINGFSYLMSAFFEMFMRIPREKDRSYSDSTIIQDIKEGFVYLCNKQKLFITIAVIGIAHLFVGALLVSLPFLAGSLSKDNIQVLGNFQMVLGVGMLVGAIAIQIMVKKEMKDKHLFSFISTIGILYVCLGITQSMSSTFLPIYMLILLLIGGTIACASVYWQSILQMHTSNDMAGRVFSISSMIGNISLPISYGIFGILLNYISFVRLMMFSGAALIMMSMFLLYFYSDKRENAIRRKVSD